MATQAQRLTAKQFRAACKGHKFTERAEKAAYLVLVVGVGLSQSARDSGLTHRQSVYRTVRKVLTYHERLIKSSDAKTRGDAGEATIARNRGGAA